MTPKLQKLHDALAAAGFAPVERLGELTIEVQAAAYKAACDKLRDSAELRFEQLIDLCGVDYASYGDVPREGPRFAVVNHLLSITHNWRLRLRTFCPDDEFPLAGHVEMRYDPDQRRVIYQPVTIDPREVTPRLVREKHYADGE
jgi:NADH-quinone oxidoreductase subunit C